MRVGEIHPATLHHLQMMNHYRRLYAENRVIEQIKENVLEKQRLRVQEAYKGQHVDVMV